MTRAREALAAVFEDQPDVVVSRIDLHCDLQGVAPSAGWVDRFVTRAGESSPSSASTARAGAR